MGGAFGVKFLIHYVHKNFLPELAVRRQGEASHNAPLHKRAASDAGHLLE
ncbi:MAG: hypothetical protein ACI9H6_000105 [Patiriisocius sp.]|jgi:hypothetical protein